MEVKAVLEEVKCVQWSWGDGDSEWTASQDLFVAVARGQLGNPRRGTSAVGSRNQRTSEAGWEDPVFTIGNCRL